MYVHVKCSNDNPSLTLKQLLLISSKNQGLNKFSSVTTWPIKLKLPFRNVNLQYGQGHMTKNGCLRPYNVKTLKNLRHQNQKANDPGLWNVALWRGVLQCTVHLASDPTCRLRLINFNV